MKLGMVGLGRMGSSMALRLLRHGQDVVGTDLDEAAVRRLEEAGGEGAADLEGLVGRLEAPRAVWLMLPAGEAVDAAIEELLPLLAGGDTLVDGGNSRYTDTVRRAGVAARAGVHLVDCGTSGGIHGLEEGYSLMVGGEEDAVERLRPVLESLAPATDRGWGRVGPVGSGHFVKMVHNGIEYGLMQAYAEGFALLEKKREFALDVQRVAEIWRHGSVVRSWLLDLVADVLRRDPSLEGVAPWVADSGEGRWTVFEAVELDQAAPVITLALLERLRSRDERRFDDRLLAALRRAFGGHATKGPS